MSPSTSSTEDRRRVLDLLARGKITVEEAEQLLSALGGGASGSSPNEEAGPGRPRYLRVAIHKTGSEWHPEKEINIRVPLSLVRSGMRLGALVPGSACESFSERLAERLRERGINVDAAKLNPDHLESVLKDLGELSFDVDQGKAHVRITCE